MRSKAHFRSHPIHPALIPFPFAFLTGAFLFDLAGYVLGRSGLWTTGSHLAVAGVLTGLLAAVPGVIDYLYSVPPGSSGQARAWRHGVLNVLAVALFATAWFLRGADGAPGLATLGLEAVGASALLYSGWLGGTLVTRNMISVDHRYASAGKWQDESYSAPPGEPVAVGAAGSLEVDQMKLLRINGARIVLARTAAGYRAFDDGCTHRGGSLAGSVLVGGTVQCLWHGSQFDTGSGAVIGGPAKKPVKTYQVQERDGQIVILSPPVPR